MGTRGSAHQIIGAHRKASIAGERQHVLPMINGDTVAIDPPLHLGVLAMAQRARDLANTAELLDNVAVGNHERKVHMKCTYVNMAYVRLLAVRHAMAKDSGELPLIAQIAARSGLKGNALAAACGWKGRNGPQPYLEGRPVTLDVAAKFAAGLVGKGVPPITPEEILATVEDRSVLEAFWDAGPSLTTANGAVLTSTFALLLDSVGIDPDEDERAQKLARLFPNALRQVEALRKGLSGDDGIDPGESPLDPDGDRPTP